MFHLVLASLRTLSVLWLTICVDGRVHFHKLRMAEYPYRTSSVTECPSSYFEHPLQSTKQIRWVQWQTDRSPSNDSYELLHVPLQPTKQDRVILFIFENRLQVIDCEAHSKFRRLWMSEIFYAVGESLLGNDITTGDITYITSFSVGVGYKVYNTSDITRLPQ